MTEETREQFAEIIEALLIIARTVPADTLQYISEDLLAISHTVIDIIDNNEITPRTKGDHT